jgi:hypothetical protein
VSTPSELIAEWADYPTITRRSRKEQLDGIGALRDALEQSDEETTELRAESGSQRRRIIEQTQRAQIAEQEAASLRAVIERATAAWSRIDRLGNRQEDRIDLDQALASVVPMSPEQEAGN